MRIASNRTLPKGALHVMTIERTRWGINKVAEDGNQLSHVSWLGSSKRRQGTVGTNCRLADALSSAVRARRAGVHGQQYDISGDFVAGRIESSWIKSERPTGYFPRGIV